MLLHVPNNSGRILKQLLTETAIKIRLNIKYTIFNSGPLI